MAAAGDAANMQMMYGNGTAPAGTPLYGAPDYAPPPTQQPHDSPPIAQGLFTPSPHHGGSPQVVYEVDVSTQTRIHIGLLWCILMRGSWSIYYLFSDLLTCNMNT